MLLFEHTDPLNFLGNSVGLNTSEALLEQLGLLSSTQISSTSGGSSALRRLRRTHLLLCVHSADMGEGGWGLAGAGAVASAGSCGGAVGSVAAAGTLPLQYSY